MSVDLVTNQEMGLKKQDLMTIKILQPFGKLNRKPRLQDFYNKKYQLQLSLSMQHNRMSCSAVLQRNMVYQ